MGKEDYVTFEVAKLLKEKGYQQNIYEDRWIYGEDGIHAYCIRDIGAYDFVDTITDKYQRPKVNFPMATLWDAQKYLRETHNISVEPYATASGWKWCICKACKDITGGTHILGSENCYNKTIMNDCGSFSSYEQALNEGIKEALKMI